MEMKNIGIIGLGNMGIGMAANLLKNGFKLSGFDLREDRLKELERLGGKPAVTCQEVAENSDIVFIMVFNGQQVKEVVLGETGLLKSLKPGSVVIVSATINPAEVKELEIPILDKGINLIDSPVSGGKSGADNGTLTLMTACKKEVFEDCKNVLEAVGQNIYHVDEEIGIGQTVKAALQALIGASFTAIFESLVLGVKAGVKAETLYEVFSASGVGSPLFKNVAKLIMERKFKGTGSHIGTMYKDLGISMNMAKENGVAMFTTSAAYELFRSGKSLFPEEDNWSIVKLLEQIAGTEVKKQ
ncbi:MAG: NAD(P)-dependent oxidoreductase [Candidatus Marinimicrobia bacterium]|nr:NAD(P)-dependent oxidoreductase [Candidatus Neomarinimicrobiota bacterium]MCH8069624.1 NAD(P)-dependent oxidoreductase [Candidatus Neomarinimicrobiota bacterium]